MRVLLNVESEVPFTGPYSYILEMTCIPRIGEIVEIEQQRKETTLRVTKVTYLINGNKFPSDQTNFDVSIEVVRE